MPRKVKLCIIPPESKRGFADVDPRFGAGKMPNDENPNLSAKVGMEGDLMDAPRIIAPDNPLAPKVVAKSSLAELLALFSSQLVH